MTERLTGYDLSRAWFDWCFENTEKITPNHTALFFFAIEHCNRLGWKEKFGFPMEMAKNAIGIKNYRTYSKTFDDLVEWGFFVVHQKSKNQWSANIIAIAKNTQANAEANTTAPTKALDKAIHQHLQKHSQKQVHGTVGIDKQIQNNTEQYSNLEQEREENEEVAVVPPAAPEVSKPKKTKEQIAEELAKRISAFKESLLPFKEKFPVKMLSDFASYWTEPNNSGTKFRREMEATWDIERRLRTWASREKGFQTGKPVDTTEMKKRTFVTFEKPV